jgi:hypothetical protein
MQFHAAESTNLTSSASPYGSTGNENLTVRIFEEQKLGYRPKLYLQLRNSTALGFRPIPIEKVYRGKFNTQRRWT